MIEKFFRIIIANPRIAFSSVIGFTMMWAMFIPNLNIDFSIEHLFSQDDPAVEQYFSFRDLLIICQRQSIIIDICSFSSKGKDIRKCSAGNI